MSNSSLISYTKLSPNHSGKRTKKIDTVTIHCMAGQLSVESCGALFAKSSRQASSNYGIGPDGRIALYVDEGNRSWCTSSNANDQRAVTVEVAHLCVVGCISQSRVGHMGVQPDGTIECFRHLWRECIFAKCLFRTGYGDAVYAGCPDIDAFVRPAGGVCDGELVQFGFLSVVLTFVNVESYVIRVGGEQPPTDQCV